MCTSDCLFSLDVLYSSITCSTGSVLQEDAELKLNLTEDLDSSNIILQKATKRKR